MKKKIFSQFQSILFLSSVDRGSRHLLGNCKSVTKAFRPMSFSDCGQYFLEGKYHHFSILMIYFAQPCLATDTPSRHLGRLGTRPFEFGLQCSNHSVTSVRNIRHEQLKHRLACRMTFFLTSYRLPMVSFGWLVQQESASTLRRLPTRGVKGEGNRSTQTKPSVPSRVDRCHIECPSGDKRVF